MEQNKIITRLKEKQEMREWKLGIFKGERH
jgi:hypothetical protein